MQYDNHYVGAIMANWTRGVATVQIRAAGPVGRHTIEVTDAISFDYLNLPQSPIPWATGKSFTFTVTKDLGRPKNRMDWPVAVTPTLDAKTTMSAVSGSATGTATARLSSTSGPGHVEGRRVGERPDAEHACQPRVVDRRRQPRQLQRHLLELRLRSARHRHGRRRRHARRATCRSRTASAAGT